MSRDQIQKQTRLRASLLVCTRRCHTVIYTHKKSHKRKHPHARTRARANTHTHTHTHTSHKTSHARRHTHTHTNTHVRSLSVSLSPPPEKLSRYHPRTALVPFLSSQKPFPVPLGYPQTRGLKRCSIGTKNSQIVF